MRCPFCSEDDDKVVESRSSRHGTAIRRRRECIACERRFTTYESVELAPLVVVKRDGRRESYRREKLLAGVATACAKLPIPREEVEALVDRVENTIHGRLGGEVDFEEIGQEVMTQLAELDQVAYVRFASVYRRYQSMLEFLREVQDLRKG